MPLSFFSPHSKVHKQRNIMRETDSRLASYSRRGLALSLAIFCLSLYLGQYYQHQPTMAIVFAIGIAGFILLRAYYLFRFEAIYARAPSRWRNVYFAITIVNAAWWGLMLAAVTFTVGLNHETPLLWLYTIAFFSSCSHVFSPYKHFYQLYLLVTLLPCSIVAMMSLEAIDSVYGLVMLVLFFLLRRQGTSQGDAYWARLQATYDLTQRANALEAENITSQSTLTNKDTLFINFADELKTSLREIMGSLQLLKFSKLDEEAEQIVSLAEQKNHQQIQLLQNILEFSQISRKKIVLGADVVDLRGTIEKAIMSISDLVYKRNHELFTQFSADLPVRVRGDGERVEQILLNIITGAVDYIQKGNVLIDVSYSSDKNNPGKLEVSVNIKNPLRNAEIEQQLHDAFKPHHYASNMSQGLSLAIAKGLANCMEGEAGTHYTSEGELCFWFTANLPTVTPANTASHNISKLNGKRVLLYQPPRLVEGEYKQTLEAWGLSIEIFYNYDEVIAAIEHSSQLSNVFDLIIINTFVDNLEGVALSKSLEKDYRDLAIPQLICITEVQSKSPAIQELLVATPVELILKPISYKQMRKKLKDILIDEHPVLKPKKEEFLDNKKVLLLQHEEIDRTIAEVMLKKLGCVVTTVLTSDEALDQLQRVPFDAFITDSDTGNMEMEDFIDAAKIASKTAHTNGYMLPILGLSHQEQDGEETKCLQSGMNYYIDLPLQIDDLRAILRRWIGRAIHLMENADNIANKVF